MWEELEWPWLDVLGKLTGWLSVINWRVYFQNLINPLFWYFWEKQVSLTEFRHMSMGKQHLDLKQMYLRELSGSKFHSVTSSNVILYNDVKKTINFIKSGLSGFGNELFNYSWWRRRQSTWWRTININQSTCPKRRVIQVLLRATQERITTVLFRTQGLLKLELIKKE